MPTMPDFLSKPCTAFQGPRRLASGPLIDVVLAVKTALEANPAAALLTFDDATGAVVDLDLRGSTAEIVARLSEHAEAGGAPSSTSRRTEASDGQSARRRGRPRLGVVAREVTLLPRHWDWLNQQPGGASQALRRLVDNARRGEGGRTQARTAQAAAYAFMAAMAGDLAGFEEATRALFAGDHHRFAAHTVTWPPDIRSYAETLMSGIGAQQQGDPSDASLS